MSSHASAKGQLCCSWGCWVLVVACHPSLRCAVGTLFRSWLVRAQLVKVHHLGQRKSTTRNITSQSCKAKQRAHKPSAQDQPRHSTNAPATKKTVHSLCFIRCCWSTFVFVLFRFSAVTRTLLHFLNHSMSPQYNDCLLYTSPSPRDATLSRMPSSA